MKSSEFPGPGWYVFEGRSPENKNAADAHYVSRWSSFQVPQCRAKLTMKNARRWSVVSDIGVVHLCEACKTKLRE